MQPVFHFLVGLVWGIRDLLAIAAGAWLIVFTLWDGWPEGQLTGTNAIITGVVLVAAGSLAVGAWLGSLAFGRGKPTAAETPGRGTAMADALVTSPPAEPAPTEPEPPSPSEPGPQSLQSPAETPGERG